MSIRYSLQLNSRGARVSCAITAVRTFVFSVLLCLGSVHSWAQQTDQQQLTQL